MQDITSVDLLKGKMKYAQFTEEEKDWEPSLLFRLPRNYEDAFWFSSNDLGYHSGMQRKMWKEKYV